jgi:hypothetical protein
MGQRIRPDSTALSRGIGIGTGQETPGGRSGEEADSPLSEPDWHRLRFGQQR